MKRQKLFIVPIILLSLLGIANPSIGWDTSGGFPPGGTTLTYLRGDRTWQPVNSAVNVTGIVAVANGGSGTGTAGLVYVLKQDGTQHSLTGTTTSTLLASFTIPANTLLNNSQIRINTEWSCAQNTANLKDGIVKIGSTTLNDSTNLTSNRADMGLVILANRGATNSQIAKASGSNIYNYSSLAPVTYSFDFTQNQTVNFYGTLAVATETMSLEYYSIVHYPAP